MRVLSILFFIAFYCGLCFVDKKILGEVNFFENFLVAAIAAGVFNVVALLLNKRKP